MKYHQSVLLLFLFFLSSSVVEASLIPAPDPSSEFIRLKDRDLTAEFCAEWNPDFAFQGGKCCGRKASWKYRKRGVRCTPSRAKKSFCDEMTQNQISYISWIKQNKGKVDLLKLISSEMDQLGTQAQCSPHDGFLSWGRPILSTSDNRVKLRRPDRCVNFGTDRLVAMVEWVGRKVHEKYTSNEFSKVHLLVGDVSAPRGGCLAGKGGKVGHASHMTGQDVDLGFLIAQKNQSSPNEFTRRFYSKENWWLLKQVLNNPFVCVKKVFLDQRYIRRLRKVASKDSDWFKYKHLIQHSRGHRNHFHIRVGEGLGATDCLDLKENQWVSHPPKKQS